MITYKHPKPYKSGFLSVGESHEIYYELSGNPHGKNVIFIHGGPGGGFSNKDKIFFNPKKFNLLAFDQRGSGRSKPSGLLKANTSKKLVEDISKLLNHLNIKKTIIFGGSWGSTLSLLYAIKYPQTVSALVVRGIFLGTKKENDYFTYDSKSAFPEEWEKMASLVPEKYIKKRKIEQFYYKKIKSRNKKISKKYAKAWANFEFSTSFLKPNSKLKEEVTKEIDSSSFSLIELHYLTHLCFLPENYILNNCPKISHIPCSIIQGRYDKVCMPSSAYELHKRLPKSKLLFTLAGHASFDEENTKALVSEMDYFSKI